MANDELPSQDLPEEMLRQHAAVSEWAQVLEAAGQLLDQTSGELDQGAIERFFKHNVHDHTQFEEGVVFPAVLGTDPGPAIEALIHELRKEHIAISRTVGALFVALRGAHRADEAQRRALSREVKRLVEALLLHAAKEDDQLLPYLTEHQQALVAYLRTRPRRR